MYKVMQYFADTLSSPVACGGLQLTWSHYDELLKLNDIDEINYYIMITEQQNLSIRQLREKIKNKEYERLDEVTKNKLITNTSMLI